MQPLVNLQLVEDFKIKNKVELAEFKQPEENEDPFHYLQSDQKQVIRESFLPQQDGNLELEHQVEAAISVTPEEKTESYQWVLKYDMSPIKLVISQHKGKPTDLDPEKMAEQFQCIQSEENLRPPVQLVQMEQNVIPIELQPQLANSGASVTQQVQEVRPSGSTQSGLEQDQLGNLESKEQHMELIQLREKVQSYDILQPEHILELIEWMQRQHGFEPNEPIKHENVTLGTLLIEHNPEPADSGHMKQNKETWTMHNENRNGSGVLERKEKPVEPIQSEQFDWQHPNTIPTLSPLGEEDPLQIEFAQPNYTLNRIQQEQFTEILYSGHQAVLNESMPLAQIMEQLSPLQEEENISQPQSIELEQIENTGVSDRPEHQEQLNEKADSFESILLEQKIEKIENLHQPFEIKLSTESAGLKDEEFGFQQPGTSLELTDFVILEQKAQPTEPVEPEKKVDVFEENPPEKNLMTVEPENWVIPHDSQYLDPKIGTFEIFNQDTKNEPTEVQQMKEQPTEYLAPEEKAESLEWMENGQNAKPITSKLSEQKVESSDGIRPTEWTQSEKNGDQNVLPVSKENESLSAAGIMVQKENVVGSLQVDETLLQMVQSEQKNIIASQQAIISEEKGEIDRVKPEEIDKSTENPQQPQNEKPDELYVPVQTTKPLESMEFRHNNTLVSPPFQNENQTESIQSEQAVDPLDFDGKIESLQAEQFLEMVLAEQINILTSSPLIESEQQGKPLEWLQSELIESSSEIVHPSGRNETLTELTEQSGIPIELTYMEEENQANSSVRGWKKKPGQSVKQVQK